MQRFLTSVLLTCLITNSVILPAPIPPVVAQSRPQQRAVVAVGTPIAVRYPQATVIRVAKGKTQPLTLEVARSVRDNRGNIVIPVGSKIVGQLQPVGEGLRFVAQEVETEQLGIIDLEANSGVVTRTEVNRKGASRTDILAGTASGAAAATIIAGTTGDRRINPLEVLAGAAIGTLAGWGLPESGIVGGRDEEVIVIEPQRDLTLKLRRQITLTAYNNPRK